EDATGTFVVNGNGGTTSLTVDDTIYGGNTYAIDAGSVSHTGLAITYSNLATLNILGGTTANTYNVRNTTGTTSLVINATADGDIVNAGMPGNLLDGIGNLTVNGGAHTVLNLDDQANVPGRSDGRFLYFPQNTAYVVTNTNVTRYNYGTAVDTIFGGSVGFSYTTSITYSNLTSLVINGGTAPNNYVVGSTAAATTTTINAGLSSDTGNIGASVSESLDGIPRALSLV